MSDELAIFDGMTEPEKATLAKHSARYMERQNPRLVAAIKTMVAWGVSQNVIVEQCNVSHNIVAAIAELVRPVGLDTHKREIISGLQRLGRGILRRLTEAVESGEEIPFQALGIVFGITTEKEQLLAGAPTSRVEHVESPEVIAFRELLAKHAQRQAGMVFQAENPLLNAGDVGAPAAELGAVVDVVQIRQEGDS